MRLLVGQGIDLAGVARQLYAQATVRDLLRITQARQVRLGRMLAGAVQQTHQDRPHNARPHARRREDSCRLALGIVEHRQQKMLRPDRLVTEIVRLVSGPQQHAPHRARVLAVIIGSIIRRVGGLLRGLDHLAQVYIHHRQRDHRHAVTLPDQRQQHMRRPDLLVSKALRLLPGQDHDLFRAAGESFEHHRTPALQARCDLFIVPVPMTGIHVFCQPLHQR